MDRDKPTSFLCPWCLMQSANPDTCDWCKRAISYDDAVLPVGEAPSSDRNEQPEVSMLAMEFDELNATTVVRYSPPHYILGGVVLVLLAVGLVIALWLPGDVDRALREAGLRTRVQSGSRSSPPPPPTRPMLRSESPVKGQAGLPAENEDAAKPMASPTPNTNNDSPVATLPPEDSPRPVNRLAGRVRLGDARLSFENDGLGHEQALGRVLIVNDGDYAITDFRLILEAGAGSWSLIPFEGSTAYPTPILSRRIEPGGQLDVPVMTGGYYISYSVYGPHKIRVEATVDGPPGVVSDEATVY